MDSLRFGSWKDFSLGWWNVLASAWFPASGILKVWHCGSNFVLVYAIVREKSTNAHSRKLTKLSMTIFSKFWSRDRYPICIHGSPPCCFTYIAEQILLEVVDIHDNIFKVLIAGSLSYLYSWLPTVLFYLHRGTSLIGSCWHVSRGGRPLACHFANTSLEMAKNCLFSFEDIILLTEQQPRRQLSVEQFAGWILPIPLRLIITISTDYIPPLLTKYGVYNAVKCFSRNK